MEGEIGLDPSAGLVSLHQEHLIDLDAPLAGSEQFDFEIDGLQDGQVDDMEPGQDMHQESIEDEIGYEEEPEVTSNKLDDEHEVTNATVSYDILEAFENTLGQKESESNELLVETAATAPQSGEEDIGLNISAPLDEEHMLPGDAQTKDYYAGLPESVRLEADDSNAAHALVPDKDTELGEPEISPVGDEHPEETDVPELSASGDDAYDATAHPPLEESVGLHDSDLGFAHDTHEAENDEDGKPDDDDELDEARMDVSRVEKDSAMAQHVPDVTVLYSNVRYSLFGGPEDHEDDYFLRDVDILDKPISDFFSALREIVAHELSPTDELVIRINELDGLELRERSSSASLDRSFGDILNLYYYLLDNEGSTDDSLLIHLIVAPDSEEVLNRLYAMAEGGRGLSEVTGSSQAITPQEHEGVTAALEDLLELEAENEENNSDEVQDDHEEMIDGESVAEFDAEVAEQEPDQPLDDTIAPIQHHSSPHNEEFTDHQESGGVVDHPGDDLELQTEMLEQQVQHDDGNSFQEHGDDVPVVHSLDEPSSPLKNVIASEDGQGELAIEDGDTFVAGTERGLALLEAEGSLEDREPALFLTDAGDNLAQQSGGRENADEEITFVEDGNDEVGLGLLDPEFEHFDDQAASAILEQGDNDEPADHLPSSAGDVAVHNDASETNTISTLDGDEIDYNDDDQERDQTTATDPDGAATAATAAAVVVDEIDWEHTEYEAAMDAQEAKAAAAADSLQQHASAKRSRLADDLEGLASESVDNKRRRT